MKETTYTNPGLRQEVKGSHKKYEHWSGFLSILAWQQGRGAYAHISDEAEGGVVPEIIIVFQLVPSGPPQRRL